MELKKKIIVIVFVIVLTGFGVKAVMDKSYKKQCKKKYTICKIQNIKKSLTQKVYYDLIYKVGKEERFYEEIKLYEDDFVGSTESLKEGYYFIGYCLEEKDKFAINLDLSPIDVNNSYLDSSWNTFDEIEVFYSMQIYNKRY